MTCAPLLLRLVPILLVVVATSEPPCKSTMPLAFKRAPLSSVVEPPVCVKLPVAEKKLPLPEMEITPEFVTGPDVVIPLAGPPDNVKVPLFVVSPDNIGPLEESCIAPA